MTLLLALLLLPSPQHKKAVRRHKPTHHAAARTPAGIAPARAREIEQALVDKGYLQTVSGTWDAAAAAAMKKFQAEHHWQTRYVPDARALIALGLGPHPVNPAG